MSYEYTTGDRRVAQYTSLDFSGLQPGEYTQVVREEDLVAGLQAEKKVKFKLVEKAIRWNEMRGAIRKIQSLLP